MAIQLSYLTDNEQSFSAIWQWARRLVNELTKVVNTVTGDPSGTFIVDGGSAAIGGSGFIFDGGDVTGVATPYAIVLGGTA